MSRSDSANVGEPGQQLACLTHWYRYIAECSNMHAKLGPLPMPRTAFHRGTPHLARAPLSPCMTRSQTPVPSTRSQVYCCNINAYHRNPVNMVPVLCSSPHLQYLAFIHWLVAGKYQVRPQAVSYAC